VLTAFVRSHAPWPPRLPGQFVATAPIDQVPELQVRAPDVQASVTVLGRGGFARPEGDQGNRLDLHADDLRRAQLRGADLERADLRDAHLDRANLVGAHLEGAILADANLKGRSSPTHTWKGAYLADAHLEGADLGGGLWECQRWGQTSKVATTAAWSEPGSLRRLVGSSPIDGKDSTLRIVDTVASAVVARPSSQTTGMRPRRLRPAPATRSAFAGFRFPPDVIVVAVRWYLRFGLSYRDVEELLAERGVEVDHVTVYRWVQRFTPLLAEAARPCRHAVGGRWFVDETYVKVAGRWRYVYRAIDQFDQVIDVFVSPRRDITAARRFFERAIATTKVAPVEVVTDRAATYPVVLDELLPAAWHRTEQYANNRVECDHGRLKARLRPMRGLKQDHSARVIIAGHAFVQNVRRGHYELATEEPVTRRVMVAFDELAIAI
jgi:transposase-like protein